MASLNDEDGPKPPMLFYLQRQLDAMRRELAERHAQARIQDILAGAQASTMRDDQGPSMQSWSPRASSSSSAPSTAATAATAAAVSTPLSAPRQRVTPASPPPAVPFTRIPLPSELAWQNSSAKRDEGSSYREQPRGNGMPTFARRPANNAVVDDDGDDDGDADGDGGGDGTDTPRSDGAASRATSATYTARSQTDSDGADARRPPRRSSSLRSNVAAVVNSNNSPSKKPKASAVLNQSFGSEFCVAATEKRLRFYPKKEVKETPEELRARERLERRKAAMKRLMSRREEQQARAAELKQKRRHNISHRKRRSSIGTRNDLSIRAFIDAGCVDAISGNRVRHSTAAEIRALLLVIAWVIPAAVRCVGIRRRFIRVSCRTDLLDRRRGYLKFERGVTSRFCFK